jgi:ABC-type nickel/cobalt efflux system permease component RcnA
MIRGRRGVGVWLGVLLALALGPAAADGHPLGNFSISHYAGIEVQTDAVQIRYLIDMAEIPTFQESQERGLVIELGHPSVAPWLATMATSLARGLRVEVNGRRLTLTPGATEILFPPGAGGLPTLKLGVVYRAPLGAAPAGSMELSYADENFADRTGWKEIVVRAGTGVTLVRSTAPESDRSRELSDYPVDLLNSPPQDLTARVVFGRTAVATAPTAPSAMAPSVPATGADAPIGLQANRQTSSARSLAELITRRDQGAGLLAMTLLVAVVLGAFHALEPGHGKTVVAAYLVGARGTAWHAVILGLVVTISHTAGVYLLGGVTFYASNYIVPERLYPWLSLISGLTIAVLGAVMLARRLSGRAAGHHHGEGHHHHGLGHTHGHAHHHGPGGHSGDHVRAATGDAVHAHTHAHGEHAHGHGDHVDSHEHDHAHPHVHGHDDAHSHARSHELAAGGAHPLTHGQARADAPVSLRALVALGVSGGIIPCPAALVVLLSALSMHRVGFGLVLIVAFSVGLAAVLVIIGVLMVYASRLMTRFREDGPWINRWLPLTSSAVMTLLGLGIALQAVAPWIPR